MARKMVPIKTIKYSLILGAMLAPVMISASFANVTLNGNMYQTGTQASPYTVTDPGSITLNGNLTVTDSNGTDGGYVNLNSGNLLIIGPNGGVDVSGNTAGARGGVANITGGTGTNGAQSGGPGSVIVK